MASFEEERKAIEGYFSTQWALNTNTMKTIPILYENSKQKQPTTDFAVFRVVNTDAKQAEIVGDGPCMNRYFGLVQVDILVKPETGTATGKKIADEVSKIFRRKQLVDGAGGISTFKIPSIRNYGTLGDRYRVVVTCPYQRDVLE